MPSSQLLLGASNSYWTSCSSSNSRSASDTPVAPSPVVLYLSPLVNSPVILPDPLLITAVAMFPSMTCSRHSEYSSDLAAVARPQARHEEGGGDDADEQPDRPLRPAARTLPGAGRRLVAVTALGTPIRLAASLLLAVLLALAAPRWGRRRRRRQIAHGYMLRDRRIVDRPSASTTSRRSTRALDRVTDSHDGRGNRIGRESSPLLTSGLLRAGRGHAHVRLRPFARLARRAASPSVTRTPTTCVCAMRRGCRCRTAGCSTIAAASTIRSCSPSDARRRGRLPAIALRQNLRSSATSVADEDRRTLGAGGLVNRRSSDGAPVVSLVVADPTSRGAFRPHRQPDPSRRGPPDRSHDRADHLRGVVDGRAGRVVGRARRARRRCRRRRRVDRACWGRRWPRRGSATWSACGSHPTRSAPVASPTTTGWSSDRSTCSAWASACCRSSSWST